MEYFRQLFSRSFWDTWDWVFNRSVASSLVGAAIFASTLLYLRYRKKHRDLKKQLADLGIAILFTGGGFVAVFCLHFFVLTPKTLVEENRKPSTATAPPAAPPSVAPLKLDVDVMDAQGRKELAKTKKELEQAQETIRSLDPLRQPIASATAVAEVFVASGEQYHNHFMDRGGVIGFCRGSESMLATSTGESFGRSVEGQQVVVFKGIFNSPIAGPLVGKPLTELGVAEYIQFELTVVPDNAEILHGTIVFTLNGTQRFQFEIPPQTAEGKKIFVRDLFSLRTKLMSVGR